jgi:hypothetical protein
MKEIGDRWRIVLVAALTAGLAAHTVPCLAQQTAKLPLRDDVVAVTLTEASQGWAQISIAYPGSVSEAEARKDLTAIARTAKWDLSAPQMTRGAQDTEAVASMLQEGRGDNIVWAAVCGLKRFSRVTVAAMGSASPKGFGRLENQYLKAQWSGGGGVWTCDVTVKDRTFKSVEQLGISGHVGAESPGRTTAPAQPVEAATVERWKWLLLVGAALALSGAAYALSRHMMGDARP